MASCIEGLIHRSWDIDVLRGTRRVLQLAMLFGGPRLVDNRSRMWSVDPPTLH
jgi:hypothetical protein